jgi:hypothetical protein
VSVQLHYPEVFDGSSGNKQEDLGDQAKNFIDFEQGLDWTLGMVGHEVKRQTAERPTQVG